MNPKIVKPCPITGSKQPLPTPKPKPKFIIPPKTPNAKQVTKPTKPKVQLPTKAIDKSKLIQKTETNKQYAKQKYAKIKLADLPNQISAQKCTYLVDLGSYSMIYFKYKGRIIDIEQMVIEIAIGHRTKEQVVENIRKSLLWGIKTGDNIYFNLGSAENVNELLGGVPFWQPRKIFVPHEKLDIQWFKSKIVSPNDPNTEQNTPGKYKIIIGSKEQETLKKIANEIGFSPEQFIGKQII